MKKLLLDVGPAELGAGIFCVIMFYITIGLQCMCIPIKTGYRGIDVLKNIDIA